MTLKRIAEMAGTSVSSVSKAFAGSKEIGEETKEKILTENDSHNSELLHYIKDSL